MTLGAIGDTRLVTEPDPRSPFRRFPWAQLAFCLACLAMTAWTWMRYSYAWDVTPAELSSEDAAGWDGRYVFFNSDQVGWPNLYMVVV